MASLVGVTAEEVEALERGTPYVEQDILERYAVALGMSTRAVLAGEEPSAVAMLFRSMRANGTPVEVLASSGLQGVLGSFVRCVREMAGLRYLLGEGARGLDWLERIRPRTLPPHELLHQQAHRLAAELRDFLNLAPDAPIPSMCALARQLGITTFFVEIEDEQVRSSFDGAALLDPDPAILINLVNGGDKWWRTRMTIAHEICHLLHDRDALDPLRPRKFFLLSPRVSHQTGRSQPWQLTDHFDGVEARANSFAGELLAPSQAIRQLVGDRDPTQLETIKRVGDHFMIGATAAINRLRDTYNLSYEQRRQMNSRTQAAKLVGQLNTLSPSNHPDAVSVGAHLRGPELEALVLRALSRGVIDAITARRHLGLRMSDPLPAAPALTEPQRAPMLQPSERARNAAESYLSRLAPQGGVYAGTIVETRQGWCARVVRRAAGDTDEELGELVIERDFSVREPSWMRAQMSN